MKHIILFLVISLVSCQPQKLMSQDQKITLTIGNNKFTATLYNTQTAQEFISLLPMTILMTEMGGYEKYYNMTQNLSGSASNVGTIYEGDLMVWSSNCLVLFYVTRSTSYSYMRLGKIDNTIGLRSALGTSNVQITFALQEQPTNHENTYSATELHHVTYTPQQHCLSVSGKIKCIALTNTQGKVVVQTDQTTINTQHLSAGVYLLKIESLTHSVSTQKVVLL